MKRYAIKVPLAKDDYIYVTRPSGAMYEVEPVLYDNKSAAQEASVIWGPFAKVVVYEQSIDD
jgi:hypothetical protein